VSETELVDGVKPLIFADLQYSINSIGRRMFQASQVRALIQYLVRCGQLPLFGSLRIDLGFMEFA